MKNCLIFYGGWEGHEPKQIAEVFKSILENEGFEVTLSNSMNCLCNVENLKSYDLLVPVWTMDKEFLPEYINNISEAIASGVGLAGCHGIVCGSFSDDINWQFIIGSHWVAHPGDDGVEYNVSVKKDTNSEIVTDISDFYVKSEQYYLLVDPSVKILATTKFPVADGFHTSNGNVDMPVAYTKMWGNGKIFYNSLGHHADIFDIYEVHEIMRRGFLWATRKKPVI